MNISVSPELIEMTMKLVFTWGLHVYVSVQWLSRVWLFVTPWMLTCQASLSMQFLRQEYWSGLPFPSSGDLPNPGINSEVKWSESHSVMSDSLQPHGLYSPRNSPVQNTGVGSLSLLQGIFPTQGSNPGLPNCRQILYQLSHQGSPRCQSLSFSQVHTFLYAAFSWYFCFRLL